jgi:hypothetical protein
MNLLNLIKKKGINALRTDPYHFHIQSDEEYPQLHTINYDQIRTKDNGKDPVIRQARGIIIDMSDPSEPRLVCYPFNRFYNYGEGKADPIDQKTAKVVEKADGSLIKLYFHPYKKQWVAGSRNRASILKGTTLEGCWEKALIWAQKTHPQFDFNRLDRDCTYMLELIGPDNQIVVQYLENQLVHLGTRSMKTLQEIEVDIGLPKPKLYDLNDQEELFKVIQDMVKDFQGREREGVIVVDGNYNRVKIKSPSYLLLHNSTGPNIPLDLMCMRAVLLNDADELKTGRKDLTEMIDRYQSGLKELINMWHRNHAMLMKEHGKDAKQFANAIQRLKKEDKIFMDGYHFQLRTGKLKTPEDVEDQIFSIYDDNKKIRELIDLINKFTKVVNDN